MDVGSGLGTVVRRCPSLGIDGFAEAEVECELGDDLPAETNVCASAKTVHRGNGEGIQHIVLVGVNAVVPLTGIEALEAEAQGNWCMV